ncbi:MAG: endolytic transglycosylase MltG [Actinobacteria bacterium]|nr:endolytic transglycosylase MltG [Actinomycetota bacterium]MDQ3531913.1 endolytic transglycosylase MltG [Actinomycetota bacterium]
MSGAVKALLASLMILAVLVGSAGAVVYGYLQRVGVVGDSDPGKRVTVVIARGSDASEVGDLLARKKIIPSGFGFQIATFLEGGGDKIQAGRYKLPLGLTAKDALARLTKGARAQDYYRVTFQEGSWLTDFAETLAKEGDIKEKAFMEFVKSGKVRSKYGPPGGRSLEGLLFPSTYEIGEGEAAASVVKRLVEEFDERATALKIGQAPGLSPYEAVIVASMIEAEARVESDRAKISTVIQNRLHAQMALGIDATLRYALRKRGGALTLSDLAVDSPYNTREVGGLPPTPIAAPGEASLRAAIHPADGDWLYYVVSDCRGRHAFTESYDQFLADKARYRALTC